METAYKLLERGVVPDFILRPAIRALCRQRLREIDHGSPEANHEAKMQWIERAKARTLIADKTDKANEQHYEVPTEFMMSTVGPRAKYSCCLYPTGKETLAQAEDLMLADYCEKAKLEDGMDILDLGCGWGSLSLYLAEKYPNARIVGLSNSKTQKVYIDGKAEEKGFKNLEIITGDVNYFDFEEGNRFDRVISIEMFEHMKNYSALMKKIAKWLKPNNKAAGGEALAFIHVFCHKSMPYDFEESDGWMAKYFFTGGTMPSSDMLIFFQSDLDFVRSWRVNGKNYARTAEDWLKIQDKNSKAGIKVLEQDAIDRGLSPEEGRKTFYRFRVFYLAVAELFGMYNGEEWGVSHFLFKARD